KSLALYAQIEKRAEDVKTAKKEFGRMKQFADRLAKDDKDAEANLEMGKYLSLIKGNFDKGLPLLAKGKDAALKTMAERDLAKPKEVKAQVERADDWYKMGEAEKGLTQRQLYRRALHWYQQAMAKLEGGLTLARVKRQVEELAKLFPTASISLPAEIT